MKTNRATNATYFAITLIFFVIITATLTGCQKTPPPATFTIVGPEGGIVDSAASASVEIPPGALNQNVAVDVADTSDANVRQTLAMEIPYAGALTIDATAVSAIPPGPVDAALLAMLVTVPLKSALPEGTGLDVYLRGETEGQWILLDATAVVNPDGRSASFETNRVGTFILREPDEYSVLTIDYDSPEKAANTNFAPALGFGLHSVNSNPSINKTPIILIHGVGSHENSAGVNSKGGVYARWDGFITWAQTGGLDLSTFELWWFLHNSYLPMGFDPSAQYSNGSENNAQQLAEAIAVNRATGKFPGPEHQFIIVAHSRGGLVARTFVEKLPGAADEVMAVITLATPHHGSPLAVPDWTFQTIADSFCLGLIEPIVVWQNLA